MITLNIKLKQFLEIEDLNLDDDDALEDLSDFDPEVVTSDLGEAEVSGSCQVSIIDNPKTAVRDLDLTISLHDEEQAKSFVSEDMDISEDFSDMDYLAFLRYYLGDWEGAYLNDELYDFENELVSGEISTEDSWGSAFKTTKLK